MFAGRPTIRIKIGIVLLVLSIAPFTLVLALSALQAWGNGRASVDLSLGEAAYGFLMALAALLVLLSPILGRGGS